jgi:hypothetical protein
VKPPGAPSPAGARLDKPGSHAQSDPEPAMDRLRSGRTLTTLGLIALAILAGAAPAIAYGPGGRLLDVHAHASAHSTSPDGLAHFLLPVGALLVIGLALLGALAGRRRAGPSARGRAIAVALSLVLTVFTVETTVHSVHHLADPEAGADCSVLSVSQNLAWGAADLVATDGPPLDVTTVVSVRSDDGPRWQLHRPSQGRAPPA